MNTIELSKLPHGQMISISTNQGSHFTLVVTNRIKAVDTTKVSGVVLMAESLASRKHRDHPLRTEVPDKLFVGGPFFVSNRRWKKLVYGEITSICVM